MNIIKTKIPGLLLIEPKVFNDSRGFFYEIWNKCTFQEVIGLEIAFKQDNRSRSNRNVLRGLHYQLHQPQGKLVWVTQGKVLDVVVDLRRSSPTFGEWFGIELSEQNFCQLWVPPGLAHGFLVKSDFADFFYKATDFYAPEHERCLLWNDPQVSVDWTFEDPLLSEKDKKGCLFSELEVFP